MTEKITVTLTNKKGLHARPSALLSKTAALFKSSITIEANGKSADAKSVVGILTLGAPCGAEITFTADGEDASVAVESLATICRSGFADYD